MQRDYSDPEVAIQHKNELRKHLHGGGYTPLPLPEKRIKLRQWQNVTVTEAEIDRWEPSIWGSTGLRLDELVGIDFDIEDNAVGDMALEIARRIVPGLKKAAYRHRDDSVRFMIIARLSGRWLTTDSNMTLMRSSKYTLTRTKTAQIEIFTGPGKYIGAFGVHTMSDGLHPPLYYRWGKDLPDKLSDLPVINPGQGQAIITEFNDTMDHQGFTKLEPGLRSDGRFEKVFDLKPMMAFAGRTMHAWQKAVDDGAEFTLDHRSDCSAFRPGSDSPTGAISTHVISDVRLAGIVDFKMCEVHYLDYKEAEIEHFKTGGDLIDKARNIHRLLRGKL